MSATAIRLSGQPASAPAFANDVHSKLNPSTFDRRIEPRNQDDVVAAIGYAAEHDLPLACCGGRHAMGGQQFASGGILLDMRAMDRILDFDIETGVIEVEAGIQWPALMQGYLDCQQGAARQWAIRQKQTGADRLSIGGALAANMHGRVLDSKPFVRDVIAFQLVTADGNVLTCSREQNAELFSLVIGGYGLFGVVTSVRLQLVPRQKLQRIVEIRTLDELPAAFAERIDDGYRYGDFQYVTDESSDDFLRRGVFSCYRPVAPDTPIPDGQIYLSEANWQELVYYAHVDKARAFEQFARFYRSTSGQIYWSDSHQFSIYLDDYHDELDQRLCPTHPGTEMLTEVYVPLDRLPECMARAADALRATGADLIYGTIRVIRKDDETYLAWARADCACVTFNLHVEHTATGIAAAARSFGGLIDIALNLGGSYFLTYHRFASPEQVQAAYPQFAGFLARKRQYDPRETFSSDWYRHYAAMFENQS